MSEYVLFSLPIRVPGLTVYACQIWDLKTNECVGALVDSHVGMVFCVASDATKIVSTSHDATMAVQDCESKSPYSKRRN